MTETSVALLNCCVVTSGILKIARIGAGIGVIIYDDNRHIGAGLHVLASHSMALTPPNPFMYADTAIPGAIAEISKKKGSAPFSVAIAGGAALMGTNKEHNSGSQLIEATKEALKKAGLQIKIEQTGGNSIRSMILDVDAGKIKIT